MTATPTPLRELLAKAIADHIGHGMAEKCEGHADAVLAALSARDAAGECECKGTGFIGQHLPNGDYEPDTWTCPKHTPPASGEAVYEGTGCVFCDLNTEHRGNPCTAAPPAASGANSITHEQAIRAIDTAVDALNDSGWPALSAEVREALTFFRRLAAVAPAGMKWPERFACNGPQGTFWTDDAALANKLIAATFDRDDWTVTDVTAHPSEVEALERGRKAWADVPNAATWQREIRGLREHLRAALAARTGKGE